MQTYLNIFICTLSTTKSFHMTDIKDSPLLAKENETITYHPASPSYIFQVIIHPLSGIL